MVGEVQAAEKIRERVTQLRSQYRACELSSGKGHNIARMVRLYQEIERLNVRLASHPGRKWLAAKDAALEGLRAISEGDDIEGGHMEADDILCDLLESVGFEDVVAEFRKVEKWYA